ncbi:energy-coupling factor transport system substrate-specific component [Desulfotomaculum arcticum]|uniref:Energy-coupling factor transport system substrate-specific component n=1 Tax=Desulfotruncus arcticus DSM 17038 TaxID=1121424 RepID=A0A1I2YQ26_9FIRM|nr:CD3073 family putative ECF transporter S component [Desulfotruncus arcticus]SFH27737.1 energy-coupling factor transport system substrate-specific component [Desulfotomaculum arcticum] [Desulfotruncus arcticus DSM 17038]
MNNRVVVTIIPVGIGINIIGGLLAQTLKLPIFLDSIGTILSAVMLGPWLGALTGLLSNVIQGLFTDPINIPFGIVNAVIGLVVGYLALKRGFEDYVTPLLAGLILAILAPIIGTPIAVYLFGGVTGGGIDLLYALLLNSGNEIFTSAFLARVPANLVDKLISAYLIMVIIRKLPENMKGYGAKIKSGQEIAA